VLVNALLCALDTRFAGRRSSYLSGIRTGVFCSNARGGFHALHNFFSFSQLAQSNKLEGLLRLRSGMNIERTSAAILISALLMAAPMSAETVSQPMMVSAQVIARAVVSIDAAPASVEVTADDISRGYVDVTAPILVRVRTNSRRGYLLQVDNVSEVFSKVELTMANASMTVSHESWIERPYVSGGDVMNVQARLRLGPGATAGSHALPIAFSASPL
jgi:hypothetical protein